MRIERGCDRPSPSVDFPFAADLDRCPQAVVPALAREWVGMYNRWRVLGALPYPGGWDEQPAVVGEAFLEIAAAVAEEGSRRWSSTSTQSRATPTSTRS